MSAKFAEGYEQGVSGWDRRTPDPLEIREKSGLYDRVFARGYWCGYHDRRQGKPNDVARAWELCKSYLS